MAITRLLRPKPRRLHYNGRGLSPSTNCYTFCSFPSNGSEKSSGLNGLKASKESKTGDEGPKKESWEWFKGILSNVKQTMIESPWFHKSISKETSESKIVDPKASEVTVTENSSASVPKSHEVIMSSPGGTEGGSFCSASDTDGGRASVNATSVASNPDNVGLDDIQSVVQPSEPVIVSHGNGKDKLRTLATHVMMKNSLEKNQSSKLSDIFVKYMENDAKRFEAIQNVLEPTSGKPVAFVDGTNDLCEIMNHRPGNGTTTFVQRSTASIDSGKNHTSSESLSRIPDLVNIMKCKKNNPNEGEISDKLRDIVAEIESLKGKNIEKDIKMDAVIDDRKGRFGEQLTIKAQERPNPNVTDQLSIRGFLKNVQNTADLQNSDVKRTLLKHTSRVLEEELTIKNREMTISNVIDERSNGGFHQFLQIPSNLQNSSVKRKTSLMKLMEENVTTKPQERTTSNATYQRSNGGFLNNGQSSANVNSDVKGRDASFIKHLMSRENKMSLDKKEESSIPTESISDEEDSSLNLANYDHVKSGPNSHVAHPVSREELNSRHSQSFCFSEEGSKDNKVLVRFLPTNVEKQNILAAFSHCGPIVNVEELSSTKESLFKDFLVEFETRKGSENALKKNYLMVMNKEDFVKPTSSEDMDGAVSIPDLIGDPEVPIGLVKNPTKTVKLKNLTEDISSKQLKQALAVYHPDISNIILGSTSSVVYVEFKTEDAKERALAQQSVLVSAKKLPILRIDTPMTTVVRISNINPNSNIWRICNSYGQVTYMAQRTTGVVDVHFKLAEWPNMLKIVNSLNGIEVKENRWLAQPAPVFPPEIFRALWRRPEERRHVNAVIHKLLREVMKPISTTESSQLNNLATSRSQVRMKEESCGLAIANESAIVDYKIMKGLLRGIKYMSQVFEIEKEPEMQIGNPTDVKHVAHIGMDGPSANKPSWIDGFSSDSSASNSNQQIKPLAEGNQDSVTGNEKKKRPSRRKQMAESSSPVGSPKASEKQSRPKKSSQEVPDMPKKSRQKKPKGLTGESEESMLS